MSCASLFGDRWSQSARRRAHRPIMRSLSPRYVWWRKPIERPAPRSSTFRIPRSRQKSERKAGQFTTGRRSREKLWPPVAENIDMASVQKITLSASRDIPFNKLVLSQANVRRVKAGVWIEELADDIARRTLLQSLSARPVLDAEGNETGMFEVPAGGRRYRALELLVKQKRMNKTQPVPCIVRTGGL